MNKLIYLWVLILATILLGLAFFGGYSVGKKTHPAITAGESKIDTVYICRPVLQLPVIKIKAKHSKPQLQPVPINPNPNNTAPGDSLPKLQMAAFDTTIDKVGRAQVEYLFPPWDYFNFRFQAIARKDTIIYKTIYVPQIVYKKHWYDSRTLWYAVGAVSALYLTKGK